MAEDLIYQRFLNNMKINVTETDIKRGIKNSCFHCPIALALRRAYKKDISASIDSAWFGRRSIDLPVKAIDFITSFDYDRPVKPFSFDLPKIENWHKMPKISEWPLSK